MSTKHPTIDSAGVGLSGVIHAELLCEAVDIHPGELVLDITSGDGAVPLSAALRCGDVTTTEIADAPDLPFEDDVFDVVLSAFGVMFAPDQQRVADELVRVCRPGGRIGMANWAPVSLIGGVLRATDVHVPRAKEMRPPIEWGAEQRLRELFGNRINSLHIESRRFIFRYRSPEEMLEYFRMRLGPTKRAFELLDADAQRVLAADLVGICTSHNRADDGTLVAPSDYVEVVAVIR